MARINIEECWWSDPRRTKLLLKIGFAADAAAVNMWRTAQEFWGKERGLIPKPVFDKLEYAEELIAAGLADVRDRSVYVRGSSEHLEWLIEKRELARESGKKGGVASAKARAEKYGSAVPRNASNGKTSKQNRSDAEAESSEPKPSYSYSGSGSPELVQKELVNSFSTERSEIVSAAKESSDLAYPKTFEGITSMLPAATIRRWLQLYPDEVFLQREVTKALNWCDSNPHRRPRKPAGWSRFLSHWFERGWVQYAKTMPTNQPSTMPDLSDVNWTGPEGGNA